uniref:J domain-containing protein n=1 Tax=Hanusia phi TaxID=3032 RepID=A0A7S0F1X6_9CRYP|mmetsp:Transcript_36331/g.81893  ORF Transcript_36331/g.81893 Transcript_36331/m.81893 type:complete len:340 (+) Transcript_36331:73-1092(+)
MNEKYADHYTILGLAFGASPEEVKAAHKKLALKYHPDKNKGDENAGKRFMEIQEAYQALSDEKVREAYDAMVRAKKQREAKINEMDKKRKADVNALLERERLAKERRTDDVATAENKYMKELTRMREKNKKIIEEAEAKRRAENERKVDAIHEAFQSKASKEQSKKDQLEESQRTLKVKWVKKYSMTTELLSKIFGVYGEVDKAAAGKKSGLVVFKENAAAANASHALKAGSVEEAKEFGISVEWLNEGEVSTGDKLGEDPSSEPAESSSQPPAANLNGNHTESNGNQMPSFSSFDPNAGAADSSLLTHRDYESLTLMRMRQAAERQRLAAQLAAEDGE